MRYDKLGSDYYRRSKYDIFEISDDKWYKEHNIYDEYKSYVLDYVGLIKEPKESEEERIKRLSIEKIINRDIKIDQILGTNEK